MVNADHRYEARLRRRHALSQRHSGQPRHFARISRGHFALLVGTHERWWRRVELLRQSLTGQDECRPQVRHRAPRSARNRHSLAGLQLVKDQLEGHYPQRLHPALHHRWQRTHRKQRPPIADGQLFDHRYAHRKQRPPIADGQLFDHRYAHLPLPSLPRRLSVQPRGDANIH